MPKSFSTVLSCPWLGGHSLCLTYGLETDGVLEARQGFQTLAFVVMLLAGLVQVTCGIWRTRWRSPSSDSAMPVYPGGGHLGVPDRWWFRDPPPNAFCWVSTSHSVQPIEDTRPSTTGQRWPCAGSALHDAATRPLYQPLPPYC